MPDRPDLADRLLAPEAYPHAVVTPIRVVETHISRVLLTGAYAYKIKKPVRLSFLDYSTLAKRRACCDEEVRLNRRYAPDLYLGVSAVGGPATAPRIDGGGDAIEYAVRMRQFDRLDELGALLATRGVDAAELAALGEHVARFHASAAPVVATSTFGTAGALRKVIVDNFASLRSLPEAAQWQETVQALEQWVDLTHGRLATLIGRRRESGQVRECHGDLHCGNVVRWQGALTPFDGIEFDPGLRFIDVANDIAFLTMDLAMHDRHDLRRAVLQAWTRTLGDFGGLPLLPYFETYRALVRAKVAALRALQEQPGSQERSRECGTAERYLDWAVGRARRSPPRLVLTCGLSGSGKTSIARAVATPLGALHVRSDVERKRLAGLRPLDDSRSPPDGGIYSRGFTSRTYARLLDCAANALQGGESVIVDAAFLKRDERQDMLDLAARSSVPAAILHCVAPLAVLRERLESRSRSGDDASEAGVAILSRQPAYWEEFGDEQRRHVVAVDTTAPDAAARALDELRALGVD
jgi:aminoglycoside phosphotransferase family enzyme/predicted kinase